MMRSSYVLAVAALVIPLSACGETGVVSVRSAQAPATPDSGSTTNSASPSATCTAIPIGPPGAPSGHQPSADCPSDGYSPSPRDTSGPAWDYGSAGLISQEDFKGKLSGLIFSGEGWQGDYRGKHFLLAAGSTPPAGQTPDEYTPKGEAILVIGPLETAPADADPPKSRVLAIPSTPGPLRVGSVDLPNIDLVGPTQQDFQVDITTGVVSPRG